MKKITFILFALIAGTGFAQETATGTATVNAEIVSPISITTDGTNLEFGRIIGNATGGTVAVAHTTNERTASADGLLVPSTDVQASTFSVTAANGYNYSVTIPTIDLTGDGEAMAVTFTSSLGESASGNGDAQTLSVGGELTINGGQAEGDYTGTVTVTVAYE